MVERAVWCGWLDQAARESLQVSVVLVGSGRERLGDMEPLINLHVAKQAIASTDWTRSSEKDRVGVFW